MYKKQKFSNGVAATAILDISNEMCAHHCAELAGKDCQAYEYCESVDKNVLTRSCRVTSIGNAIAQSVNTQDVNCNMYAKPPTTQEQSIWRKKFASPALATIMALIFLSLGAVCGGLLYRYKFAGNVGITDERSNSFTFGT